MPHDDSDTLDSLLDSFDAAWQSATPPVLDDFLPPREQGVYEEALRGLVRIDLERRLRSGEAARLEPYLQRYPELRQNGERLEELVLFEGEVRRELGLRADPAEFLGRFPELADRLMGDLDTGLDADTPAPSTAAGPAQGPELDLRHYVLLERVGRGGMGEVYRGRDPALARQLAVKVLRPEYRGHPEAERRFEREARINGVLQHPSIVPVHNLGRLPDGRLYFTMKLIQGRTLADLFAGDGRADRLPELLGIFEKVCQALAYAHSRRIIHRDLKPANIMVGAFGEVQVMDWGLAKALPRPVRESAGESTIGAVLPTGRPDSTAGKAGPTGQVGTPAYMPPEQARAAEDVDERADVFGLGAILCELLTGLPPYTGERRDDVLRKAETGELSETLERLAGCGADTELVDLCQECLTVERHLRPRDAGVVAARVAAYQAAVQERLRQAEKERAAAQAREEEAQATAVAERKARRRTGALAVAVLGLFVGVGSSVWWVQQRRQETNAAVSGSINDADRLLDEARSSKTSWADAPKLYAQARDAAHRADELARSGGVSATLRAQAADLARSLDDEVERAERDRRLLIALLEVRAPREGPKFVKDEKGLMLALAEPSADEQFAAAFRAWDPTFDVAALTPEGAAARLRDRPAAVRDELVAALDDWAAERWRARPRGDWQRVAALAKALDGGPGAERRGELRRLLLSEERERERALEALAAALRPVLVPFEAEPGSSRRQLRKLAAEADAASEPVLGLLVLGRALAEAGEGAEAERLLRAAVRARPAEVTLRAALGRLLGERKRWAEAVECWSAARALRPELGLALAEAQRRNGQAEEGMALYVRLIAEQPEQPMMHFAYGKALNDEGRHKEAEAPYREAIRLQPDLPMAHSNLGGSLLKQGRYKEAETACREAIRLQPDLPQAHINLGGALVKQGQPKEAEAACREALRLQPDFAGAYITLGITLVEQRRLADAEAAYREALRLQPDFAEAYYNLGVVLSNQGRSRDAEATYRTAIRLNPDDPQPHNNLGALLLARGRPKDAEVEFRATLQLRSDLPEPHYNLGNALLDQGRHEEAEAAYREALHLRPDYAEAHCNRGKVLRDLGRYKESEEACREAIRLQPEDHNSRFNLGFALNAQGRFTEALEQLRRGEVLSRNVPGWPFPSAEWVRQCERLIELDRKLPAVLRGEVEPANAGELLEFARLCQHRARNLHVAAVRFAAAAFAANPRLAEDLRQQLRYDAACSAVRAAAGQAEDAKNLPDKVRLMMRRQALSWLRADLTMYQQFAERAPARPMVRQLLGNWPQDTDLASIRDRDVLDTLPEEEQKSWRDLWDEVDRLLQRVKDSGVPNKP
jgi:serine/threonine-protein kinase